MTTATEIDEARLRKLAMDSDAIGRGTWYSWSGGQQISAEPCDKKFISAVTPRVVLALLDEIQSLRAATTGRD